MGVFKRIIGAVSAVASGAAPSLSGGGFDGAASGRRLAHFESSRTHVNTMLASAGPNLVARSRHLVRNNGYAAQASESFAANTVGDGIKPSADIEDDKLKKQVQDLWRASVRVMDFDGISTFYGLQQRIAREEFTAGEVFVRMMTERRDLGLPVPMTLQLLPSEMLPLSLSEELTNGNTIRQGIEFNKRGRRVAYHFYRQHPGDYTLSTDLSGKEYERIPASQVLHIFDPREAGQIRGYSRFAPVMARMFLLDQYDDAEVDRKKTAALFAGFIKKTTPDETANDAVVSDITERWDDMALADLEPGTLQYLQENEDITFSSPADVGGSYEAFQYRNLLHVASGLNMPYVNMTGDMVRSNFANTRSTLLEARRKWRAYQNFVIINQFCVPVWSRWMDLAHLSGVLNLPDYEKNRWAYHNADWRAPRWDWIDPLKDITAEEKAVKAGFKPRSKVQSEFGLDPEQTDNEIARDQSRAEDLGLEFNQSAAKPPIKEDAPDAPKKEPSNHPGSPAPNK